MSTFQPKAFSLLAFDIYGTLIDWETGIHAALLPLFLRLPQSHPSHPSSHPTSSSSRHHILSTYTTLEQSTQRAHPTLKYTSILESVYDQIAQQLNLPVSPTDAAQFSSTIGSWPAFSDTVAAMQQLSKRYKLVALSNVDKASFAKTLAGPLKGEVHFNAVYTAEDIGSYKPDVRNFEYLLDHVKSEFGVEREGIWMVAQSLVHDHVMVKEVGMKAGVWIDRKAAKEKEGGEREGNEDEDGEAGKSSMGGRLEELKGKVDIAGRFVTLGDFAAKVEKAF